MRKIFAMLFTIILLFVWVCAVPVGAVTFEAGKAPTYHTSGDFKYSVSYDGNTTYINGYRGEATEDVVIPATLDGHQVDGFFFAPEARFPGMEDVKSIIISEGIPQINLHTFQHCSNLESITIPTTVTSIGQGAFKECTSLKTVIYNGTEKQFAKIVVEEENLLFHAAEKIFMGMEVPPVTEEPEVSLTPSVQAPAPEKTPTPVGRGPHTSDILLLIGLAVIAVLCVVGFWFIRK